MGGGTRKASRANSGSKESRLTKAARACARSARWYSEMPSMR
jgi:hypothetical protein